MDDLFSDPRPEIIQDSGIWTKLLRLIPKVIEPEDKADLLIKRLWTARSIGTLIRPSDKGLKLVPLLDERGAWGEQAVFDEIAGKYLKEYATEINLLLRKVVEP